MEHFPCLVAENNALNHKVSKFVEDFFIHHKVIQCCKESLVASSHLIADMSEGLFYYPNYIQHLDHSLFYHYRQHKHLGSDHFIVALANASSGVRQNSTHIFIDVGRISLLVSMLPDYNLVDTAKAHLDFPQGFLSLVFLSGLYRLYKS